VALSLDEKALELAAEAADLALERRGALFRLAQRRGDFRELGARAVELLAHRGGGASALGLDRRETPRRPQQLDAKRANLLLLRRGANESLVARAELNLALESRVVVVVVVVVVAACDEVRPRWSEVSGGGARRRRRGGWRASGEEPRSKREPRIGVVVDWKRGWDDCIQSNRSTCWVGVERLASHMPIVGVARATIQFSAAIENTNFKMGLS
jgi:hypothetical protein